MSRVIQLSVQADTSEHNAGLALDHVHDLRPVRRELALSPSDLSGHVWAFSPKTQVNGRHGVLAPGDLAIRIDRGKRTSRIYEVIAFRPDRPDLAPLVNGQRWRGRGPFPHFVAFKPFVSIPETSFLDLVESLQYDTYVSGTRSEARFIPVDATRLAALAVTSAVRPAAPTSVRVPRTKAPRRRREVAVREGSAIFRAQVLDAQRDADGRIRCSACDIDDVRVIEAAHVVDYGYLEDAWWNGIPLCRNHHRLFDLGVIRLDAEGSWIADGEPSVHLVSRKALDLVNPIARDVVVWRAANF